jgi:molybdate transport system substrate-binding protein
MADAVTIDAIAGGAPKLALDKLGPLFEQRTGHRLALHYDTMSGIRDKVAAGDKLDVLLMPVPLIDAYVKDGTVKVAGRATLGIIGLGVAIKAGVKVPDISTPDKLRQALLAARAVVHATPSAAPSGAHSDKVIKQLGIAEAIAGRIIHRPGFAGGVAMVASGEAELGIFPKSEIVNVEGVALAGSLPPAMQLDIIYGAGIVVASPVAGPAASFIQFLIEPESRKVWTATGFDPPAA